jgi:uncharacterized protein YegP (UPF0339 family)
VGEENGLFMARFVAENVAAIFLTRKSYVMNTGGEGGILDLRSESHCKHET